MLSVGSKSNESHTRIQTIYVPVFHCYFSKNDTFDDTITEVVTTSPLTEQKSSSNFNQTILRRHSAMYECKRKQHSYMNVVLTVLSTIKQTEHIMGVFCVCTKAFIFRIWVIALYIYFCGRCEDHILFKFKCHHQTSFSNLWNGSNML